MRKYLMIAAAISTLGACSEGENAASFDIAESAAKPEMEMVRMSDGAKASAPDEALSPTEIPVSLPQIAYSYDFGFRVPASEIPKAQQAHVALCEKSGPQVCRVLNMANSGSEGDYATGRLHMEVTAARARAFGNELAKPVEEYGGSQIAASISGEDLSKKIVDTEARLRSRTLLSQRLTELLRTKSGSVKELVEAERAVTQVNEEIDQARSWLTEMRGRMAFSKIIVDYESGAPGSGGFTRPIRDALAGLSSILGSSIGGAITLTALLLPWILTIGLAIYLRRRFKADDRTFWGRRRETATEQASVED